MDTKRVDTIIEAVELIGIALHLDALHQLAFDVIDLNQRHAFTFDGHLVGGRVGEDGDLAVTLTNTCEIVGAGFFREVGDAFFKDRLHRIAMLGVESHFGVVISGLIEMLGNQFAIAV